MALQTWPATLPAPAQYTFALRERRRAVAAQDDPPAFRRFARDPIVEAQVRWVFTAQHLATFDTFFASTLAIGARWFSIPLPGRSGVASRAARFIGPPRVSHLAAGVFGVAATLEVRTAAASVNAAPAYCTRPPWTGDVGAQMASCNGVLTWATAADDPESNELRAAEIFFGIGREYMTDVDCPTATLSVFVCGEDIGIPVGATVVTDGAEGITGYDPDEIQGESYPIRDAITAGRIGLPGADLTVGRWQFYRARMLVAGTLSIKYAIASNEYPEWDNQFCDPVDVWVNESMVGQLSPCLVNDTTNQTEYLGSVAGIPYDGVTTAREITPIHFNAGELITVWLFAGNMTDTLNDTAMYFSVQNFTPDGC